MINEGIDLILDTHSTHNVPGKPYGRSMPSVLIYFSKQTCDGFSCTNYDESASCVMVVLGLGIDVYCKA